MRRKSGTVIFIMKVFISFPLRSEQFGST